MTTALTDTPKPDQANPGNPGNGQSQDPGQASPSWRDGLPEALKAHQALQGFDQVEQLAKRYVAIHDQVPQVPATADAYQLEGVKASDEVLKSFREMAHGVRLTNAQAKSVFDYWAGLAAKQRQANQQAAETAKAEAETKLKQEWGADYEANMAKSVEALKRFGGDEFAGFLETSGLGNHPSMARFLLGVRKVMSEDVFIPDTGSQPKGGPVNEAGERILNFPSMKK